ncbi:MAG: hypothetical protein U0V75_16305 [Ferruginibacter sp.]
MDHTQLFQEETMRVSELFYILLHNREFKKEFSKDPDGMLKEKGITLPESRAYILQSLSSQVALGQESLNNTMALANRFKDSIKTSLDQIETGYKGAMWMYWIAFITGVVMILTSIVFAFVKEKNLLSIVFGGLGTLDLLVFFLVKPPLELQNSRIGFARLEAAFTNWFIDLTNLNSVLLAMNNTYFTSTGPNTPPVIKREDFDQFYKISKELSMQSIENTQRTLAMMGTIVREEEIKKTEEPGKKDTA